MWSRQDKPPEPTAVDGGKVNMRVLASRKNHRLALVDDDTSAIDLALGDSSCALHLEKDESSLGVEKKLVITAEEIEIKATQKLSIEAPDVEVTASSGALTMSGKPIKLN
jgi:hypothetical protein